MHLKFQIEFLTHSRFNLDVIDTAVWACAFTLLHWDSVQTETSSLQRPNTRQYTCKIFSLHERMLPQSLIEASVKTYSGNNLTGRISKTPQILILTANNVSLQ